MRQGLQIPGKQTQSTIKAYPVVQSRKFSTVSSSFRCSAGPTCFNSGAFGIVTHDSIATALIWVGCKSGLCHTTPLSAPLWMMALSSIVLLIRVLWPSLFPAGRESKAGKSGKGGQLLNKCFWRRSVLLPAHSTSTHKVHKQEQQKLMGFIFPNFLLHTTFYHCIIVTNRVEGIYTMILYHGSTEIIG